MPDVGYVYVPYTIKNLDPIISENEFVPKNTLQSRYAIAVVGRTDRGPRNRPLYINSVGEFVKHFGKPDMKKGKRIFSELDPYGEENWEE